MIFLKDDLNNDTISYSVEKNLNNTKPTKTNQILNDNIDKTTNEVCLHLKKKFFI